MLLATLGASNCGRVRLDSEGPRREAFWLSSVHGVCRGAWRRWIAAAEYGLHGKDSRGRLVPGSLSEAELQIDDERTKR